MSANVEFSKRFPWMKSMLAEGVDELWTLTTVGKCPEGSHVHLFVNRRDAEGIPIVPTKMDRVPAEVEVNHGGTSTPHVKLSESGSWLMDSTYPCLLYVEAKGMATTYRAGADGVMRPFHQPNFPDEDPGG